MRKLGIIQPGKIGDIIICLPIAKWYSDKGYKIIWPIDRKIINNFLGYIDYVEFIPIDFDCRLAHQVCFNNFCSKVIDLSFTIPGANNFNTENYLNQDTYTFDEFKYFLADVPFEQKWNLKINRNTQEEHTLQRKLDIQKEFVIIQEQSSDRIRKIEWQNDSLQRVDIDASLTNSVFNWIPVFEKAQQHILIASCFTNLIDQLAIKKEKQYVLIKHGYDGSPLKDGQLRGMPRLRLQWKEI